MPETNQTVTNTAWGSNSSGGNITINSLYDLRDTLQRISGVVELSPEYDGGIDHANLGGEIKFFELDSNGNPIPEWDNTIGHIPYTTINAHFNDHFSGDWESPQQLSVHPWYGNLYNKVFEISRGSLPSSSENTVAIGIDLININTTTKVGQNITSSNNYEWAPTTSTLEQFDESDVLINLSDSFWNDVIEVDQLNDPLPSAFINPSFNGKIIDLDSLNGSNYSEITDQLNQKIDLSIQLDSPIRSVEFADHFHGGISFRNAASGQEVWFNVTDNDNSGWGGASGVGSVDIELDEFGNHIQTEIEFGIMDSYQTGNFLRQAAEARDFAHTTSGLEYINTASSIDSFHSASGLEYFGADSGLDNFNSSSGIDYSDSNSIQRWDLNNVQFWTNNSDPFPEVDINDLINQSISDQDLHFYTSYSGHQNSDPYTPIQFEVSDFTDNTLDYLAQEAGFDLQLNGPIQTDVLNKPLTNYYSGSLNYRFNHTDADIPDLGSNLHINIGENYDGLGSHHLHIHSAGLGTLHEHYPLFDSSIEFYLQSVSINSGSDDGTLTGNVSYSRNGINDAFSYDNGHGIFTNYSLEGLFPDINLIDTLTIENAFNPVNTYPLSAQFELIDDNSFNGDSALAFKYALSAETDPNSIALTQNAVLGDSVVHHNQYTLDIFAQSLASDYKLESTDFTINFNPLLFEDLSHTNVRIDGEMSAANAVSVDNQAGTIRIAAASLSDLTGYDHYTGIYDRDLGSGIGANSQKLASITLDFSESKIAGLEKNPDGSLIISPLSFSITANQDETVFSKDFTDDDGLNNREIVTLNDLGGGIDVEGQEVTLYEAKINFEQLDDGLVIGTDRVIGSDASFTNLIRSGDLITTTSEWLNVGNIQANNLTYSALYNQNATLENAAFSQTSVASGSFINGVFVEDARESTTLTTDIRVTGAAGNVVDLADGIVSIKAEGSEVFTNTDKGSSNLITFQGDLNYDGRVSMKDLAYLNAGAARQQSATSDPTGVDADGNGIVDASVAHDVDADFNGKIDMADLSILDADWGKSLHTGDQQFQGSADVSWNALDQQGNSSHWDNDSFKDQNSIEADSGYVGSLESPTATNVFGADGNTTANDNDITGTTFQETT